MIKEINKTLIAEVENQMVGHWLTDLSNFSSILYHELGNVNWVGFYFNKGEKLILGPFVGKPACTEIALGRGVCGRSFQDNKPQLVADVHAFKDHITCDPNSNSEMVIPIEVDGKCIGVLDLDSTDFNRFSEIELASVQACLKSLLIKNPELKDIEDLL